MSNRLVCAGFSRPCCCSTQYHPPTLNHSPAPCSAVWPTAAGRSCRARESRLREVSTNLERSTISNEQGLFELPLLPPGTYNVQVEMGGFKKTTRGNLKLDTGQRMELPFVLTPGEVREIVEVKAEAPLLQTSDSRSDK